jgi:hypothetical protein
MPQRAGGLLSELALEVAILLALRSFAIITLSIVLALPLAVALRLPAELSSQPRL